jgi:L-ascorbate metabolism protein UlaG (beta-lactamase superfamily)
MDIFLSLIISLVLAIGGFFVFVYLMNPFIASPWYRGKKSDHFTGKHFYNIGWTPLESKKLEGRGKDKLGFKSFMKWLFDKHKKLWDARTVPTIVPPQNFDECEQFLITYVNHATILIQIDGFNILTDPVWSYRVSPFSWIGPRRFVNPGVTIEDLPPIDLVLLSHNHYDHMDISTLKKLSKRFKMPIYTGLGNKRFLRKKRINGGIDMDWWDSYTFQKNGKEVIVTFLPAQHFSARGVTDRNKTLWWGFGIRIGEKTLYFAWDTGYGEFIANIREYFPLGFDIGLLPMWAYIPRWFMGSIHTNPEESLQIQKDLNIKTGIGIHWWTFSLALDGQDEPLDDLEEAKKKEEFQNLDFRVGVNGIQWKI